MKRIRSNPRIPRFPASCHDSPPSVVRSTWPLRSRSHPRLADTKLAETGNAPRLAGMVMLVVLEGFFVVVLVGVVALVVGDESGPTSSRWFATEMKLAEPPTATWRSLPMPHE